MTKSMKETYIKLCMEKGVSREDAEKTLEVLRERINPFYEAEGESDDLAQRFVLKADEVPDGFAAKFKKSLDNPPKYLEVTHYPMTPDPTEEEMDVFFATRPAADQHLYDLTKKTEGEMAQHLDKDLVHHLQDLTKDLPKDMRIPIKKSQVFDAQQMFPKPWPDCLDEARGQGYNYIDFNGMVFATIEQSPEVKNSLCMREDLVVDEKKLDAGDPVIVFYPYDRTWWNTEGVILEKQAEDLFMVRKIGGDTILIQKGCLKPI